MYIYVFFLAATGFAIPTYGLSLLAFFLLKRYYDNKTLSAIFAQAVSSMREGRTTELFRVNRAAVRNIFARFCVPGTESGCQVGGVFMRWGVFSHPFINGGGQFSLRLTYQPRGTLDIKAAAGIDEEVLSDHLEGIGSFSSVMSHGLLGRNEANDVNGEAPKKLQRFLQNQLNEISQLGLRVHIDEITFGYISHLLVFITKKSVSPQVVCQTMKHVFSDEMYSFMIDNAAQIFSLDAQMDEKLTALFPIAKSEYEAGAGDFLLRHTKKENAMEPHPEDWDPRTAPSWTASDLA